MLDPQAGGNCDSGTAAWIAKARRPLTGQQVAERLTEQGLLALPADDE